MSSQPDTRRVICFLNPIGRIGGAERSLLDLIGALPDERYRKVLIAPYEGPLTEEMRALGGKVHIVPYPDSLLKAGRNAPWRVVVMALFAPFLLVPLLCRIGRILRAEKADILHANGVKPHFISALLAPFVSVSIVWHWRDFSAKRAIWPLYRWLARRVPKRIIAVSEAVAAELRPHLRNVVVVYNGMNIAKYQSAGRPAREDHDDFLVGICGILTPWKGHEVLLEAVARLKERGSKLRVWVVGDEIYDTAGHGNWRDHLEDMSRKLGVEDTVEFLGYRKDMPAILQRLDVLVQPSTQPETFGRTVAEGLAAGCAVVLSRIGGMPEIARHEQEGLQVEPGNAEELAEAIERYRQDPALRKRLAEAGQRRIEEHFSLAATSRQVMELYDTLAPPAPVSADA
ncbi:MAG: glycosyltransferase family 4 protein [Candidatus Lernaella stagnicola]|nr:glycosyltransferase family 4 protein [Candidatus Lernaella stagnicola]